MGILIDSSVFIGVERSGADVSTYTRGREEDDLFLSVISVSELLHGVHRAADAKTRAKRLAFVEGVLAAIPVLVVDLATARSHAQRHNDRCPRFLVGRHMPCSWSAARHSQFP